jgi:hypothetical protein
MYELDLIFKSKVNNKLKTIVKSILRNMMEGNDSEEEYEEVSDELKGYNVLFSYLEENKVLEVEEIDCWWNLTFDILDSKIRLKYEDVSYKYENK